MGLRRGDSDTSSTCNKVPGAMLHQIADKQIDEHGLVNPLQQHPALLF